VPVRPPNAYNVARPRYPHGVLMRPGRPQAAPGLPRAAAGELAWHEIRRKAATQKMSRTPASPVHADASAAQHAGSSSKTRGRTARTATSLPAWVEPQLATLTRERFSDPAWVFERKLDGERCLAFADSAGVRLLSRNQRDITSTFPEIAAALAAQITAPGQIVDGEIVAFGGSATSFAQLQQRMGLVHPSPSLVSAVPAYYYIFDVMYAGGQDVRPLPQLERKQILRELMPFADPLRYTEHRERDGERYYEQACRDRWEGLIAKRADAPYTGRRTRNWLKFKCENAQEFVVGGYTDPRGSREGFGALLLGYYDADGKLAYAGKVGTGFSDSVLRRLYSTLSGMERDSPPFGRGKLPRTRVHWVEPRLVAEVGFSEWTTDGELRHPRYQGLRDDKAPADVVRETPA
jgi:bifunctional non-homologous end joining protein LigD